jgi:hypothetical protein
MRGSPICLQDMEGHPPLPLEVDDECMTTEGNLPQPTNRPSYMCGFITITKIFKILSECMVRQRTFKNPSAAGPDMAELLKWIESAQKRLRTTLDNVPPVLRVAAGDRSVWDKAEAFGTQRANILTTALCVEFALVSEVVRLVLQYSTLTSSHSLTSSPACARKRTPSWREREPRGLRTV